MRNLNDILNNVTVIQVLGNSSIGISELIFDSRKVSANSCFFTQKGTKVDAHEFIPQVIEAGAKAIVCEVLPSVLNDSICYVLVDDSSEAMGVMASNYYQNPSSKLKLIGVTGTNGKTTTVTLLHQLYTKLGFKAGLISTVVNKIGEEEIKSTHTTPDSISINSLIAKMVDAGCSHCYMEVSSHAVVQHRVTGLDFLGGVFTNITHEHLDYHKTFSEYIKAKRGFFNLLGSDSFALSNRDDKNGEVMLQETSAKKHFYALKIDADFKTKIIESNFAGLSLKLDNQEFWSPLIGHFNAYNLTAVYAVGVLLGDDKLELLTALSTLKTVAGRFQYINLFEVSGIVDYAHSPDALENVLKTIKDIRTGNEQVITVVGCGGDRDCTKRPMMAAIACKFSDRVILTSDNPRTEDPAAIIEEMKTGVDATSKRKVLAITDRREAIRTAASFAQRNDILLVAGKGHETYQEINGVRNHFDDVEVLTESITEINKSEA